MIHIPWFSKITPMIFPSPELSHLACRAPARNGGRSSGSRNAWPARGVAVARGAWVVLQSKQLQYIYNYTNTHLYIYIYTYIIYIYIYIFIIMIYHVYFKLVYEHSFFFSCHTSWLVGSLSHISTFGRTYLTWLMVSTHMTTHISQLGSSS